MRHLSFRHALQALCLLATLWPYTFAYSQTSGTSRLSGFTYIDRNNDGQLAYSNDPLPEFVISGVEVKLFQVVNSQEVELANMLTDTTGRYSFTGLVAGTYSLRQVQPVEYVDGLDTLGMLISLNNQPVPPNAFVGNLANNAFTDIVLPDNVAGEMYNFGERGLAPGYVSKRYLLASAPPMPMLEEQAVPEPTSIALLATALVGWASYGRQRRGRRVVSS